MNDPPNDLIANIPAPHLAAVVGWWNSLSAQQKSALKKLLDTPGLSIHISETPDSVETDSTTSDDWQNVWEDEWETDWQEYLTAHPEISFLTMRTRSG